MAAETYDSLQTARLLSRNGSARSATDGSTVSNVDEEPPIDQLKNSISEIDRTVSEVLGAVDRIAQLRDNLVNRQEPDSSYRIKVDQLPHDYGTVIASPVTPHEPQDPFAQHHVLADLTTRVGDSILRVASPLKTAGRRLGRLEAMAKAGTAAATDVEIGRCREQLAVANAVTLQVIDKVVNLSEVEQEDAQLYVDRLVVRIRKDIPSLNREAVDSRVQQIKQQAQSRARDIDQHSEAWSFAVEQPFTELVKLIKGLVASAERDSRAATNQDSKLERGATLGLNRLLSQRMRQVLGGLPSYTSEKSLEGYDIDDDEAAPLTHNAAAFAGTDPEKGKVDIVGKAGKLKENWKLWTARLMLLISLCGVITAVIVATSLKGNVNGNSHASNSANSISS